MALLETDPVTVKMTDAIIPLVDVAALTTPSPFATGLDAVVIGVRTRLQLFAGEWFMNLDKGVAWLEADGIDPTRVILGTKYDEAVIRSEVLRAILDTPGVFEVTSLMIQFDKRERRVTMTWSARCQFGDTPPDTLTVGV